MEFPRLNWKDWQAKYRKDIRTSVAWDEIKAPSVVRHYESGSSFDNHMPTLNIHYPWFPGKHEWRGEGPARRVVLRGRGDVVIQAPAVEAPNGKVLLLDRCHRISELDPVLVVLDILRLRGSQWRAIVDFQCDFFKEMK